jgi:hypothetical protein
MIIQGGVGTCRTIPWTSFFGDTIAECQESMKPQLSVVALRRRLSCASWKSAIVRADYNFASVVVVAAVLSFHN